ncbi:Hypothetical predicted protein [Pelobates cultripes]|uniref:Uncharacterized protein n=1 Tax=Pelobates cultripes TaxID=61616 RepID=A0AAD1TAE7_PELCU|nr:Hypothetical predicted protein [Pelobates cultripes]
MSGAKKLGSLPEHRHPQTADQDTRNQGRLPHRMVPLTSPDKADLTKRGLRPKRDSVTERRPLSIHIISPTHLTHTTGRPTLHTQSSHRIKMAAADHEVETNRRHKSLEQRLNDLFRGFWRKLQRNAVRNRQAQKRSSPPRGQQGLGKQHRLKYQTSAVHEIGPTITTAHVMPERPKSSMAVDMPSRLRRPPNPQRERKARQGMVRSRRRTQWGMG